MTLAPDEVGRILHCRELGSGLTGTLLIAENEIALNLFAYEDRYIAISGDEPIHLQTENLKIVSLHSNVNVASGHSFGENGDPRLRGLFHSRFNSYTAVIGSSPWLKTDIVRSAFFQIDHADYMLRHVDKFDSVASSKIGDPFSWELFSVTAEGLTIRVTYGVSYSFELRHPTKVHTNFSVDFHSPQTLNSYLGYLAAVIQLFSASAGGLLRAVNICIARDSVSDQVASAGSDRYKPPHDVRYLWPAATFDKSFSWAGSSFLLSSNDNELDALRSCLSAWFQRMAIWKAANALMMECFSAAREIGPNRLLNACRWFEEIPVSRAEPAVPSEKIDAIIEAALSEAGRIGCEKLNSRISGSLRRISTESQRERLQRLLDTLRFRFGYGVLEDGVINDLLGAFDLRGKAAHGHVGLDSADEFRLLARSTYALEAFCLLLTIRDLPMSAGGVQRAGENPIVQAYRHLSIAA